MEIGDMYEMNSTLKTSALNMDIINCKQVIFKSPQSDLDHSDLDSLLKDNVCYDSIIESKRKIIIFIKRIKKDLQC